MKPSFARGWAASIALLSLTVAGPASAQFMIVGMDQKQSWNESGARVLDGAAKDLVSIIDLARPEKPRIVATLQLENSVGGPPTNVVISPDNRLALVADSYTLANKGTALDLAPASKLFVIRLDRKRARLVQTLEIGSQPSGISINPAGTLALVGYRDEDAVGVLRIERGRVREIERIPMGNSISHVAFTPDGRRALAVHHEANKISLLNVDDDKVTRTSVEIPTSPAPYVAEVTPDGRLALTIERGFVTVIDLAARPERALDRIPVSFGGEGLAISPRGNIAVSVSLRASNGPKRLPQYHERGAIDVLRIADGKVTPLKTIEVGRIPEAVGFTPDGHYLYVGNFGDSDLWIFRVDGTDVIDTGKRLPLPGRPASGRVSPARQPR